MGVEERGREGEWGKVTKVNEVREGGGGEKGRNVKGLGLGRDGEGGCKKSEGRCREAEGGERGKVTGGRVRRRGGKEEGG